ncbi:response regulator [Pleurocapsales cyanobacterium LEGE 06147]|nr:response regulator [Pleurocapsales cyanobacterium LEGE 06147]
MDICSLDTNSLDKQDKHQLTNKCILIIDNTDEIWRIAKLSLEIGAGWQVLAAISVYDGLAITTEKQIDAILLNTVFLDEEEIAALYKIKANPNTRYLPIILLAERVRTTDLRRAKERGAMAVIAKPFDSVNLAQQIAEVLSWFTPE